MDNIFRKFSANLRQALLMSEKISVEQRSEIDTEHQLLALILQKGTLANDILLMFEISIDRARLVAGLVGKQPKTQSGINQDAKEAIQLAVQFAMRHKHVIVDCEHLLLALLSNKSFNSFNIVERMGVDTLEMKRQIEAIFSETERTAANPQNNDDEFSEEIMPDDIIGGGFIPEPITTTKKRSGKSALAEFAVDITAQAKAGKIDPVIGRSTEIERLIQTLIRRKKNNPVLIGDPGVGKTAIVEGLALKISQHDVPEIIKDKSIFSLDLSSLLAGTMYRGQFETRIKKLLEEIEKNKNIILFIDELHTVIGAGSAEGSLDAANILKPKLARGEIRVIGATTIDEYKKHIEKDAAFERRFQPIIVTEPGIDDTIQILKGLAKTYGEHHGVSYTPESLESATKLSARYISDRFLPDKAIDLIDEAAASVKIKQKSNTKLLQLKNELKRTIEMKDEAVAGENYEKATFLRQKEMALEQKIKTLNTKNTSSQVLITDEDISKVVSKWTGIPLHSLKISEKKRFLNLENRLSKYIVGQEEAISAVSSSIRRSRVGVSNPNRPIGSFIFLGPTGVGKTELVKVMAREIYGSENALVKIDMSEFMEKHNVARLIGAPAGYVGYEEGGRLTEKVRRNPYSILLFDEIEKAHPEVFNILLQILEDGQLTDAKGRKIDFRQTIIILTSNIGTDFLNQQATIGFSSSASAGSLEYNKMSQTIKDTLLKTFRPELLNRLDQTIIFKPLNNIHARKIAELEFFKLAERLKEHNLILSITRPALLWIAKKGFQPEYGARPMRRIITDYIENPLSEKILIEDFTSTRKIQVGIDNNKILFKNI